MIESECELTSEEHSYDSFFGNGRIGNEKASKEAEARQMNSLLFYKHTRMKRCYRSLLKIENIRISKIDGNFFLLVVP